MFALRAMRIDEGSLFDQTLLNLLWAFSLLGLSLDL